MFFSTVFQHKSISKTENHGADNSYFNYRHHGNITGKIKNARKKVKKQHKNMENHIVWSNASAELAI